MSSFGHFVVGGSIVVGLVVFLILIIIQFVVITSGSGRVAEVAARFTLDGMPGKQMAIDADRASGVIDEHEARRRRKEIADEADFYGAMDGASKFVRGDAIAAIVITLVNLIGGLAIGIFERHLSASQAIDQYSLLSVGDGLVSQIPALLLSLSTGIIVTRAATEHDLGHDVVTQLSRFRRIVRTTGLIMALLAIVPGLAEAPLPHHRWTRLLLRDPTSQGHRRRESPERTGRGHRGCRGVARGAGGGYGGGATEPRTGGRPDRPGPARSRGGPLGPCEGIAPQHRDGTRHRDAPRAHPRQPRPPQRRLRRQGARGRGGTRPGSAREVTGHRRKFGRPAGHRHPGPGLRRTGQVDPGRPQPPGRGGWGDRRRPVCRRDDPPRRDRA